MCNYLEELKSDILSHLEDEWEYKYLGQVEDLEELEEKLNEDLFACDSVTGNASGSYTFNSWEARENVLGNIELLREAFENFGSEAEEVGKLFLAEAWESMDVTIRCYLLPQAIAEVIEENEEAFEKAIFEALEN